MTREMTQVDAPIPPNESARLRALVGYDILDTLEEQAFDDITLLASFICDTPIALISFIDEQRQWFKARVGMQAQQTPREHAFCAYAILNPDQVMVVHDAMADARFAANPLVVGEPNIRFYAGAPLVTPAGHVLGTLCVIDRKARELPQQKLDALRALSRQVVAQLELRRATLELARAEASLGRLNDNLEQLANKRAAGWRESEQLLRLFIEYAPAELAMFDREMRYLAVSRRWIADYKLDEHNLIGRSHYEVFPEIGAEWKAIHRRALAGEVARAEEDRFERADGRVQWLRWEVRPWLTGAGAVGGIVVFSEDVSTLVEARAEQTAVAQRLTNLLETMGDGFVALDHDWRYQYVNRKAGQMLGRDPASLLGKRISAEFPAADSESFRRAHESAMRDGGEVRREEYNSARGRWFENRVHATPDGISIFFTDITDRRRAAAALRDSEERLRLALRAANQGLFDLDIRSGEAIVNPEYSRMLGYEAEGFRETMASWRERMHPDDLAAVLRVYEDCLTGKRQEYRAEYRQRAKAGGWKWILSLGKVVERDADGRPTRMLGTHTDIDPIKNAEAALQAFQRASLEEQRQAHMNALHLMEQAQEANRRLQAVSARLLSVQEAERAHLARELHDQIGQALTAMKITLQSAASRVNDDQIRRQLAAGAAVADQTLNLVRGLSLDLRPPQLDDLGLAAAVRWNLEQQAHLAGLAAGFEDAATPRDLPEPIAIAAYRIAQEAITNVVRHARARTVRVLCGANADRLRVEIADDGSGFDADEQHAGPVPRSVGLASMRERAALVGGTLRIETAPGAGTRVIAELPIAAPNAEQPA